MTVYLVGAGPGDPGLLTLRAAALVSRCDLLVHDRLVDARVLALAGSGATVLDVGKRPGSKEMSQQEINALLVDKGRDGSVVRLKGGDPYLFGRGGEEALALEEAGVPYEVVPGLSAALAVPALAGVPVTLRGAASAVVVLTGHDPDGAEGLEELARSGATLVVLMAAATVRPLAERLLRAGMAPETPAIAVRSGSLPNQRSERTTLAGLRAATLESPVTLVIGAVAGERLFSFESRPLSGLRVVVTRRAEQSEGLVALLEERGAAVICFPTIAVAPPPDGGAALAAALGRLGAGDWLVVVSENAVAAVFSLLHDARELGGVRVAAVGPATAAALAGHGVVADLIPRTASAAGLLAAFPASPGTGRVLVARASGGGAELEEGLAARGIEVEAVAAYETTRPARDPQALAGLVGCDAVVFASPSAVDGYLELAGAERLGQVAVAIGPTTAARLGALGVAFVEAATPSAAAMVAALVSWVGGAAPAETATSPARARRARP